MSKIKVMKNGKLLGYTTKEQAAKCPQLQKLIAEEAASEAKKAAAKPEKKPEKKPEEPGSGATPSAVRKGPQAASK